MSKKPPSTLLVPPDNFALVESNIYRSAYPTSESIPFLRQKGIKTIALLSIEILAPSVMRQLDGKNSDDTPLSEIRLVEVADIRNWFSDSINGLEEFCQKDVYTALHIAIDTRWHPVLFACPTGEVQTSVVVGCFRRMQHWSLSAIYQECELFANYCPTVRPSILTFITEFNASTVSAADMRYRGRILLAKLKNTKEVLLIQHKKKEKELRKHVPRNSDSEASSSSGSSVVVGESSDEESGTESSPPPTGIKSTGRRPPSSWRTAKTANKRPAANQWLAPWFVRAQSFETNYDEYLVAVKEKMAAHPAAANLAFPSTSSDSKDASPPPFVRYAGVRNPPTLDSRSKYTKESIVDDDKD
ncbi:Tyrosine phosphatase family, putative [Angomonas deanei]|uniref:Tyrosine phosphatase family, putative n=1 Tax=Angomonas deanei TaxID=59799 RepID=A0A7G2CBM4_9TRYP|nr:Tyrosine phosphatase family, putative [Angomonas deanei]